MFFRKNPSFPARRSTPNYRPVNLLRPLHPLFATPVLCFQQLAASFPKTPGWGVARFPFQPPTAHCPLLTTRSPLSTFRMNTCKSVSKQRTLTTFRMNTYAKQGEGGGGRGLGSSFAFAVKCAPWRLYPQCAQSIAHTSRHHGGVRTRQHPYSRLRRLCVSV